jgi:hypothetical protein
MSNHKNNHKNNNKNCRCSFNRCAPPEDIKQPEVLMAPNDNSPNALEIAKFKGIVLEQYAGS